MLACWAASQLIHAAAPGAAACLLPVCLSVCPLRLSDRKHTDSLNLSNNSRRPPQVPLAARFATYA